MVVVMLVVVCFFFLAMGCGCHIEVVVGEVVVLNSQIFASTNVDAFKRLCIEVL